MIKRTTDYDAPQPTAWRANCRNYLHNTPTNIRLDGYAVEMKQHLYKWHTCCYPNPKNWGNQDMKMLNLGAGLLLSMAACLAQAIPITTNAPSGYAGQDVNIVLGDADATGLFGFSVNMVYDPNILTFQGGTPGTIHGDNPLDITDPGVSLVNADPLHPFFFLDTTDPAAYLLTMSLAYPFFAGANSGPGSLMDLVFTINGAALPGATTTVDFSCFDFGPSFGCFDYAFDPVHATVTVLQPASTPIPLPGTLPLMGLGCAALLWARRQRH